MKKELLRSIARISRMEEIFDELIEVWKNKPDELSAGAAQEKVAVLSAYYTSGEWLNDYTLDEQHLLPQDLKRGVLSQDGLYDLLCEIAERTN